MQRLLTVKFLNMKRKSLIYVLLSLFICSCTNDIDTTVENCNVPNNQALNTDGKFKIGEVKALQITSLSPRQEVLLIL